MYKTSHQSKSKIQTKILESLNQTLKQTRVIRFIKKDIKIKKNSIQVANDKIDLNKGDLYIAGWGKLSVYLAKAFIKIVDINKIKRGFFISNNIDKISNKIKILEGTHPYPTLKTYRASLQMLRFLSLVKANDYIIFLISGGGSSIFSIPHKKVSIQEKIIISKKLIAGGIEPKLINNIRKFSSQIKGGKLLNEIKAKRIFNILVSDENQNLMHSLASGCTVLQRWNFKKIHKELKNLDKKKLLNKKLFKKINLLVDENQSYQKKNKFIEKIYYTNNSKEIENIVLSQRKINKDQVIKSKIILDNSKFKKLVTKNLQIKTHKKVILNKEFLYGNYEINKKKIISKIDSIKNNEFFLVYGLQIEIDLKKKSKNIKGGRIQHLCLDLSLDLKKKNFNDFTVSGFASDGDDFLKNIGGATISKKLINKYSEEKISKFLQSYRSYNFHKKINSLIHTRKTTESNIMDILVLFVKKN